MKRDTNSAPKFIREPKHHRRRHQRRKGISLSISIREPKRAYLRCRCFACISLSISIREPKPLALQPFLPGRISLSISIREPKQHAHPSPRRTVSVYQYPSENQNPNPMFKPTCKYQFINIHQRTKTMCGWPFCHQCISLSISIREPKHILNSQHLSCCISLSISIREPKRQQRQRLPMVRISLSISIREPKLPQQNKAANPVSVYQYPSENQNNKGRTTNMTKVSVYQYPSENQNMRQ